MTTARDLVRSIVHNYAGASVARDVDDALAGMVMLTPGEAATVWRVLGEAHQDRQHVGPLGGCLLRPCVDLPADFRNGH